jgi:ribonucleotide reductase alpha subunit
MTQKTRKVGLGIMGLHDMLIQMELAYGSEAGRLLAAEVMGFIRKEAEVASIELAALKGPFPPMTSDQYLSGPAQRRPDLDPAHRHSVDDRRLRLRAANPIFPLS